MSAIGCVRYHVQMYRPPGRPPSPGNGSLVTDRVCIYRAPMRARDLDLPPGTGAEYGLSAGVVGIGPGRGEKAARALHRFAMLPNGVFVWTRDRTGNYRLGRIAGALREDRSPAAV